MAAGAVAAASVSGCTVLGIGAGTSALRVDSLDTGVFLAPDAVTRVYAAGDRNTADVILSDIPLEQLASLGGSIEGVTGSVLHLHMFLTPRAGRTPIEFSASNCTATLIVVADGQAGFYRGGGFMLPSDSPGEKSFSARVAQVTLRPGVATAGFEDLLGHAELSGRVSARRDDAAAERIVAWMATASAGE